MRRHGVLLAVLDFFGKQPGEVAAKIRSAGAAIARQEPEQPPQRSHVRAVVHHPTLPLDLDQTSTIEDAEVRGHRVVRHIAQPGDFTRGQASGVSRKEPPECGKARRLRQRAKTVNRVIFA